MPPLPPGFELEQSADFSGVSARINSTAQAADDGPGLAIDVVGGTPESQVPANDPRRAPLSPRDRGLLGDVLPAAGQA